MKIEALLKKPLVSLLLLALAASVAPSSAAKTVPAPVQAPTPNTPAPSTKTSMPDKSGAAGQVQNQGQNQSPPAAKNPPGYIGSIDLRDITLNDAARLISQEGQVNVVVSNKLGTRTVSLFLRNATVESAIRALARAAGVWYRFDSTSQTWLILNAEEYQRDIEVSQDELMRVFTLRHHNVVSAANAVQALFGNRVKLAMPVEEMPPVTLGSNQRIQTGSSSTTSSTSEGSTTTHTGGWSGKNQTQNFGDYQAGGSNSSRGGDTVKLTGKETEKISADRLGLLVRTDDSGKPVIDVGNLVAGDATQKEGLPIHLTYNRLHNLLLVRTGDQKALAQIETMLKEFDLPPVQVLLELKILDITLDDGFRSIFDVGFSGKGTTFGPFGAGDTTTGSASGRLPGGAYPRQVGGLGNFNEDQDSTMVWQFMNDTIRLRLQMLQEQNRVQVLATPMLVAANNQPARLFIGDEQIMVTGVTSNSSTGTTGSTYTTITAQTEKRDVGQTLTILPRINGDRSVSLTIDQDNSKVKKNGSSIPVTVGSGEFAQVVSYPIDTVTAASVQVTAHAQDGLSVAIGGMINQQNGDQVEKVPLLGDIPLFGTLFKKTVRSNMRSQLILIVTPHVLDSPDRADFITSEKSNEMRILRDQAKPPKRLPWTGDAPLPADTLLSPFTSDSAYPVNSVNSDNPAIPVIADPVTPSTPVVPIVP